VRPDGRLIALGTNEGRVILVRPESGQIVHVFQGHEDIPYIRNVVRLVFSPDGQFLASKGEEAGVYLWNINQRRLVHAFINPDRSGIKDIYGMAFRTDSSSLVLTSYSTGLYDRWRLPDGPFQAAGNDQRRHEIVRFEGDAGVASAAMSRDAQMAALGGGLLRSDEFTGIAGLLFGQRNDPRLFVYRAGEIRPLLILAGHRDNVIDIAFSPDATLLASVSRDQTLRLWRISD